MRHCLFHCSAALAPSPARSVAPPAAPSPHPNPDLSPPRPRRRRPVDPDPDGAKLAAAEDPLGEATKLVLKLKQHAPLDLRTHLAAFEVYLRKGRLLLAAGAAARAAALAGEGDGDVHRAIVRLALAGGWRSSGAGRGSWGCAACRRCSAAEPAPTYPPPKP
jgi:hypothetical protein